MNQSPPQPTVVVVASAATRIRSTVEIRETADLGSPPHVVPQCPDVRLPPDSPIPSIQGGGERNAVSPFSSSDASMSPKLPQTFNLGSLLLDTSKPLLSEDAVAGLTPADPAVGKKFRRSDTRLSASVIVTPSGVPFAVFSGCYYGKYTFDQVHTLHKQGHNKSVEVGDPRRELALGGSARVKVAQNLFTKEIVALKIVNLAGKSPGYVSRRVEEVAILKVLKSRDPENVYILDSFRQMETTSNKLITMLPFYDMKTVADFVLDFPEFTKTPLKLALALAIAEKLAEFHVRTQYCHRDLKPENILVGLRPDGSFEIKLIDFGLARELGQHCKPCGTVGYVAPEQVALPVATQTADLFSLGIIFYVIFTVQVPESTQRWLQPDRTPDRSSVALDWSSFHDPEWKPFICRLISSMLALSPSDRPNLTEVISALRMAVASGSSTRELCSGDVISLASTVKFFEPTWYHIPLASEFDGRRKFPDDLLSLLEKFNVSPLFRREVSRQKEALRLGYIEKKTLEMLKTFPEVLATFPGLFELASPLNVK